MIAIFLGGLDHEQSSNLHPWTADSGGNLKMATAVIGKKGVYSASLMAIRTVSHAIKSCSCCNHQCPSIAYSLRTAMLCSSPELRIRVSTRGSCHTPITTYLIRSDAACACSSAFYCTCSMFSVEAKSQSMVKPEPYTTRSYDPRLDEIVQANPLLDHTHEKAIIVLFPHGLHQCGL